MPTVAEVAEVFDQAVVDEQVPLVATADVLRGIEVEDFPAARRPGDPNSRQAALTLFRLAVGELAFRPDMTFTHHVRRVSAPGDHNDEDLFVDASAVCSDGHMGGPVAALATIGLHRSSLGSVDPDPLYNSQRIVVATHDPAGAVRVFRARLSARIDAVNVPVPSSDVRQDLSALRYRIFREMLYAHLTDEASAAG